MSVQYLQYMGRSGVFLLFVVGMMYLNSQSLVLAQSHTSSSEAYEINPTHIISLVNAARVADGRPPLTADELVAEAAQTKAELMASRGEFQHNLNDGTTAWQLLRETGYRYRAAGENLAVHFTDAESAVEAWLASPVHHRNIMSEEFTDTGIGVAPGNWQGYQGYYIVQLFATPLSPVSGNY